MITRRNNLPQRSSPTGINILLHVEDICLINFVLEIKDCFYTSVQRIIIHTLQTIIMIVYELALGTGMYQYFYTTLLVIVLCSFEL